MPTPAFTRARGVLMLLACLVFIATVAAGVSRELIHRGQGARMAELQQLLACVSKAANNEAEKEGLRRLAQWIASKDMTISVYAYSRGDGRDIPLEEASKRRCHDVAFEVTFDLDGDRIPERAYHLCLREPQQIGMLMME